MTGPRYAFVVEGDPVPKARPRLGAHGGTYTPLRTVEFEREVGWRWKQGRFPVLSGACELTVVVYERRYPADLDNYVKAVADALNGLAWSDDRQVARLHAAIHRSHPEPHIEVEVIDLSAEVAP